MVPSQPMTSHRQLVAMRNHYIPLILLVLLPTVKSSTFPGDIDAIKAVLTALDYSSIPPGSCLSTWDFTLDPCDSVFGIHFTCGLRCDVNSTSPVGLTFSRITDISLDAAGYTGRLSSAVWSLPFLQSLDLSNNRLYGPIPTPPFNGLPPPPNRISLSRNFFSGPIPAFLLAPSLEELYLDGNRLSGPIPSPLPPTLRRLELQSNNLSGPLPDLSALSDLFFLDASDNSLSGPFAASTLPPSLVELSMRNNFFSGDFPASLFPSLAALQVLDLSHNALSGPVPSTAFLHPSLEQLALSDNGFEWVEWPAIASVAESQIVALDLSHNRIGGILPEFVGLMPRLAAVVLEGNRFIGMIPGTYAMRVAGIPGWVPFARLLLAGNYLYGPIPEMIQRMEGTAMVSLADNCLFRCPEELSFCAGGQQKSATTCRDFNPMIP
ncbi:hypothetical protein HPP92_022023 [Vanilla planifolia]|uniref:Uncharacterized protein n=1 Tax=Vanilla planifolia TaxID=51239 RepID=A0A835PUK0_VANPL|nr:hypothetical protein HPP92_022023 [Vanilla planifolia]